MRSDKFPGRQHLIHRQLQSQINSVDEHKGPLGPGRKFPALHGPICKPPGAGANLLRDSKWELHVMAFDERRYYANFMAEALHKWKAGLAAPRGEGLDQ